VEGRSVALLSTTDVVFGALYPRLTFGKLIAWVLMNAVDKILKIFMWQWLASFA
jgi:hypothetical protein